MSFGRRVEPLIPQRVLPPEKAYVRTPGAGRPPKPHSQQAKAPGQEIVI